jgi:iron(III) transport system ATP-binding protein
VAAITVRNLTKRFEGGIVAVGGISFDVADGEFLTLLGPSGCGKTTTLRLIAGLETPDGGAIAFGDRVVASVERGVFLPPEQRDAGMVFQSYAIWPHMTVFGNVAYPLRIRNVPRDETRSRVAEVLHTLGLDGLADRAATKLSGGQQQRVAIARALVGRPHLLLLDEPLANLDAKLRAQMRVELRELQQRLVITTIYVTHDQTEALVLSDRVLVLRDGRVEQRGTPREIYSRPVNRFVADFVGFSNFLPGRLLAIEGDRAVVRLGDEGPVVRCRNQGAAVGEEVVVAARAPALQYSRAASGADSVLAGEVLSAVYLGEHSELHVQAGPWRLTCIAPEDEAGRANGARYHPGDPIYVAIDPDRALALPREPEPAPAAAPAR